MRRAKIVCTLGPAVESPEKVRELIAAGMNMARLNLSHGSYEEHQGRLDRVRAAAKEAGKAVAVLVDLQGPKIRLARFENGPHELARGDIFTITTDDVPGTKERVGTTYKGLPGDCKAGDRILIDDGKVTVEVVEVKGNDVVTKCIQPGFVSNNKGINLPGVAVSVPAMSEKDEDDLRWGLRAGADFIALSFVRNAADIKDVHAIMDEVGIRVPVIAKIEKPQAVANLVEIVEAFDGIMVARGDLGVELPIEDVPMVQKRCVELARDAAKPVIVATQMLDSMITNSSPTRAEATDCANAVLDGADALMLSGETSVGKWPVETVEVMARIIESTEDNGLDRIPKLGTRPHTHAGAVSLAAVEIAELLGSKFVCVFTASGDSLRRVARLRSAVPTIAFTPSADTMRQVSMVWGSKTFMVKPVQHTDQMMSQVDEILLAQGLAKIGDEVVVVAGTPPGVPGSTNTLRVHRVGEDI